MVIDEIAHNFYWTSCIYISLHNYIKKCIPINRHHLEEDLTRIYNSWGQIFFSAHNSHAAAISPQLNRCLPSLLSSAAAMGSPNPSSQVRKGADGRAFLPDHTGTTLEHPASSAANISVGEYSLTYVPKIIAGRQGGLLVDCCPIHNILDLHSSFPD